MQILLLVFANIPTYAQDIPVKSTGPKVTGEIFGDYYFKFEADTGQLLSGDGEYQKTARGGNSFALRRFNMGCDYTFSQKFHSRLMLEGNDGYTGAKSTRSVYIKYALLEWKELFRGSDLILGAQSTPTFATFSEKIWGYRSIEKSLIDFRKYGTSTDVGISLTGKLVTKGAIRYHVMVGNGKATAVEDNKSKKFYGSVFGEIPGTRLVFQLYTDYEKKDALTSLMVNKLFAGYQSDRLTAGLSPFLGTCLHDSLPAVTAMGWEFFVRATLIPEKLNGFVRVDFYDPKTGETQKGFREMFLVFGTDYTPAKNVHIMPNVWLNHYLAKPGQNAPRKPDLVGRVTFRYKI